MLFCPHCTQRQCTGKCGQFNWRIDGFSGIKNPPCKTSTCTTTGAVALQNFLQSLISCFFSSVTQVTRPTWKIQAVCRVSLASQKLGRSGQLAIVICENEAGLCCNIHAAFVARQDLCELAHCQINKIQSIRSALLRFKHIDTAILPFKWIWETSNQEFS